MFCPSCGYENPDDYSYCRQCGTNLDEIRKSDAAAPHPAYSQPADKIPSDQQVEPPTSSGRTSLGGKDQMPNAAGPQGGGPRHKGTLLYVIIALVVLAIAGGIFWTVQSGKFGTPRVSDSHSKVTAPASSDSSESSSVAPPTSASNTSELTSTSDEQAASTTTTEDTTSQTEDRPDEDAEIEAEHERVRASIEADGRLTFTGTLAIMDACELAEMEGPKYVEAYESDYASMAPITCVVLMLDEPREVEVRQLESTSSATVEYLLLASSDLDSIATGAWEQYDGRHLCASGSEVMRSSGVDYVSKRLWTAEPVYVG